MLAFSVPPAGCHQPIGAETDPRQRKSVHTTQRVVTVFGKVSYTGSHPREESRVCVSLAVTHAASKAKTMRCGLSSVCLTVTPVLLACATQKRLNRLRSCLSQRLLRLKAHCIRRRPDSPTKSRGGSRNFGKGGGKRAKPRTDRLRRERRRWVLVAPQKILKN